MTAITITATRSADQRYVTVACEDYIDDITSATINVYVNTLTSTYKTYTLSAGEITSLITDNYLTLALTDLMNLTAIADNWYILKLVASGGGHDYESNYEGFGVYTYVKRKVFDKINNIHTPELVIRDAENLLLAKVFLEGLEELDTSTVNSRDVKFKKRLSYLTKTL